MNDLPFFLRDYGVLRFSGPDARRFLQGQLSNDLDRLQPGAPLLAGLHNPQGRVVALLRLLPAPADTDVLAILPGELLERVSALLRRFVLRAKVTVSNVTADWQVLGVPAASGAHRFALAEGAGDPALVARASSGAGESALEWAALQVAAGVPEVYAATSGEFVAQMLNLDCLEAISWTKGCYTGQEIIARAHYRGQVKRRMRRYACGDGASPPPGDTWTTSDGVPVRVVRSARTAQGRGELLAVAPLDTPSADELPLPYSWPAPDLPAAGAR